MVAQLVSSHLIILKFRHYEVCFSVCGKDRQSCKLTMSLDQLLHHPTHCTYNNNQSFDLTTPRTVTLFVASGCK